MAMQTGTATDFLDLFRKLRGFILDKATGAGWDPIPGSHGQFDSEGIKTLTGSWDHATLWDMFNPYYGYFNFYTNYAFNIEFFEPKTIGSIRLTMPDLSGGGTISSSPQDIRLRTSDNGVDWVIAEDWTGEPVWTDLESRTFTLTTPATARYVSLSIPASNYSSYSTVFKMRMFDESGVEHFINLGDRSCARLFCKSPVTVNGLQMHLALTALCNPALPTYTLRVSAGSLVEPIVVEDSQIPYWQTHYWSSSPCAYFWDAAMPYWFYGDERSVVAFIKVGSTIRQIGFGYLLAYATPEQYNLPMYVGAENSGYDVSYDYDQGGNIRGFTNPGDGSLRVFTPKLEWKECQNYYTTSGSDVLSPQACNLWPGSSTAYDDMKNAPGTNDTNGNHILYPLTVIDQTEESLLGEIPNLFLVPSFGLAAEDTITVDGQVHRVFNNIWRQSSWDFCAVKEV